MLQKHKISAFCISVSAVMLLVSCGERNARSQKPQSQEEPQQSGAINAANLPKYEKPLKINISAKASADQKVLQVTFSGEGDCELMAAAAFSDRGKKIIGFSIDESVLETDLATMDGTIEWCILIPKLFTRRYEATISYPIPDEFAGKFADVAVTCLIYPLDRSNRGLYDAILVESNPHVHDIK